MNRSYKFRIYPNKKQKRQLYKEFEAYKFVYNYYLDKSIKYHNENKDKLKNKNLYFYDWCKDLVFIKKEIDNKWLNDVASQNLIQSLRNLDNTYKNFFRGIAGFPKFKKTNFSVRYPNQKSKYIRSEHKIKLSKIGKIKIVDYVPAYGKVLNITISKEKNDEWFASISLDQKEKVYDEGKIEKQIGIDVGIKLFLTDSDGNKIGNPKFLEKSEKKLKRAQRRLSKKKVGSNNRKKQKLILAKKYSKIRSQRKDFLNRTSTKLVNENTLIVRENLAIKNMIKNHKLAKSILSVAWYTFFKMLEYKGLLYNCKIIKIGTFEPSSKMCNNCGNILKELNLSIREWECPNCHNILDRDINAAKNILEIGLKKYLN